MCKYLVEMTDTYSGQANYSWLQTASIEAEADASSAKLIRRAKKALGVRTCAHRVSDYGDLIRLDLRNACVVIFISPL